MIGHYADACPEIWRQYHLTIKPGPPKKPKTPSGQSALMYCYNCGQEGHYGHECTERRMFNHVFPTTPFIYYYDDKYAIREREKRIKRKVKELQKYGNLPRQFKRPHMEVTDKKRQRDRRKNRWSQEKKETQKEMMGREDREHGKHRKAEKHLYEENEDFPRGPRLCSPSPSHLQNQKPHRSFHHSHHHKSRDNRVAKEGKRGKPKRKESCLEEEDGDNLFLIKQRKKKSKLQHSF